MAAEEAVAAPPVSAGPSKTPLILVLVNTLAVLAALGTVFYTKVLFKRPEITESAERDRLADSARKARAAAMPGLVHFEPTTANIQPANPPAPPTAGGTSSGRIKLHYVTLGFSLEVTDIARKDEIEELKPRIMDQLLSLLGRKAFSELTTVQGRYLLRSQVAAIVNKLAGAEASDSHAPLVTNVFFNHFIVQ
jgi:flagellar basal body-associated protein FliL